MNKCLLLLLLVISINQAHSQISISQTGNQPDSSAILDIQSTNKGLLIPRMTTMDMIQVTDPATGLLVFNIDSVDIYMFDGSYWLNIRTNTNYIDPDGFFCGNDLEYGGQTYGTVEIAGMCWMSENLNAGVMITGPSSDDGVIEKHCYNNDPSNCNTYGGLYDWNEMMQYTTGGTVQGICPPGWHIPTESDWCTMTTFVDLTVDCSNYSWSGTTISNKLKSTSGWYNGGNGSDAVGFTGLPGGIRSPGGFLDLTTYGYWWSSEPSGVNAWNRRVNYYDNTIGRFFNGQDYSVSVRCVMD